MKRFLLLIAAALTLSVVHAQTATLTRSGGILGSTADFALQGDPLEIFILMPSLENGPTPLAWFDPGDPRSLDVGIDQIAIWTAGMLNGSGQANVSYNVPADPVLHGLAVYAQFVTWPGATYKVDDISNWVAFPASFAADSAYTVGDVSKQVSGHAQTLLADGRVLISGGVKTVGPSSFAVNELEIFDPQTYTFSKPPLLMSQTRTTHTATLLADGRVLICGGADNAGTITSSVEIYDPVLGTITPADSMGSARTVHTATLLAGGRVFVAGGTSDFDFSDPLGALGAIHQSTEIYDPVADSWSSGPNLPRPRVMHNASLDDDDRVLITGGIDVTYILGIPIPGFTNDCRAYNPSSGAMQDVSDFNGARAAHGQLTLANGDVLVAGGADGNLITQVINPMASCRLYSGGSWTNVGTMANPRVYPNLLDAGGTIIAIGGLSSFDLVNFTGTPVLDVETTTQSASSWTTNGSMLVGRLLSLSTPIDGGQRVLSVGMDGIGESAEAYAVQ